MKTALLVIAVLLLAAIAGMMWQRQSKEDAEEARRANAAAEYLDCRAHAKYPDLCMR